MQPNAFTNNTVSAVSAVPPPQPTVPLMLIREVGDLALSRFRALTDPLPSGLEQSAASAMFRAFYREGAIDGRLMTARLALKSKQKKSKKEMVEDHLASVIEGESVISKQRVIQVGLQQKMGSNVKAAVGALFNAIVADCVVKLDSEKAYKDTLNTLSSLTKAKKSVIKDPFVQDLVLIMEYLAAMVTELHTEWDIAVLEADAICAVNVMEEKGKSPSYDWTNIQRMRLGLTPYVPPADGGAGAGDAGM